MGNFTAVVAATSTKSSSSSYTFLLLIVIVFVGFYFLMIRPQRRRQQQAQQQQRTLNPGALVKTTAGMYATVSAVDGDDVILEVAPGVDVRYMRRAVAEVISSGEEEPEADDQTEYAEDAGYEQDDYAEDSEPSDIDDSDDSAAEPGSAAAEPAGPDDETVAKPTKDNVF